ncbi:hypothetical protein B7Z17_01260 [Candidatus Saccharibacteria bacterium 32-49-10]|nr:MAG: hypothetical protein B7Z17_01260 [Candidatus Saccharibacteria bacterium 32-49-10]
MTGNDITDTAASSTNYAISILNALSDANYLANNRFSSTPGTATINDAGTSTVYSGQPTAENGGKLTNRTANDIAAFSVQTAGGVSVMTVDTTNSEVEVGGAIIASGAINGLTVSSGTISGGTWNGTAISGAYGGTGQTTTAVGDLLIGAAGNTWNKLTIGGNGTCLTSNGTTASWGSCGGGSSSLQGAYDSDADGGNAIIALTATDGGILLQDAATPLGTAFAVQSNGGTATYFSASSTGVVMQDSAGNSGLLFDSTTSELRVYENVASPTRYAKVYYDTATNTAVFGASSGATQIGTPGTGGDINLSLTGTAVDKLNATKTFTSAAAYSGSDFNFSRNLTGTTYALTGNLMKIEDTSTFTGGSSSPNLLYINQNNTGATGNLILARTGGAADKFKVDVAGNMTTAGTATVGGNVSIAAGASYTGAGAVTVSSAVNTNLSLQASGTGRLVIGTSDAVGTLLVLDEKTGTSDPIGTPGAMYYNSGLDKFRCYEGTAWIDCISLVTSIHIVKGATENVASSTVLQDDDDLQFTIPAGETWVFEFRLLVSNNNDAGPDWKSAVLATGASSCEVVLSGSEPAGAAFPQVETTDCTTPGELVNSTILASATAYNVYMQGAVTAGASATTVKLQWTQNTSDPTNQSVLAGSYLIAQKTGSTK